MILMLIFLLNENLKAPFDYDLHALPVKEQTKKLFFAITHTFNDSNCKSLLKWAWSTEFIVATQTGPPR